MTQPAEILDWQAKSRDDGLMLTNLFPDPRKMADWLRREAVVAVDGNEGCRLLVVKENGFDRLFFCASSIEAAAATCSHYQTDCGRVCVLDYVGLADAQQVAASVFAQNGFETMKTLTRLSRRQTVVGGEFVDSDCRSARVEDAEKIYEMLQSYFNPYAEQLPTKDMVSDLCITGLSFVVCKADKITAFLLGEGQGKKSTVRYWFSLPGSRDVGCGGMVMRRYFARCAEIGIVSQELWVIDSNDNAIKRYDHYGFKPGLLKDYVFIKGKGMDS